MSETNPRDNSKDAPFQNAFEQFLLKTGFTLKLRKGPKGEPFGNWIIQYANDDLEISIVSDRDHRSVTIADIHTINSIGILPPHPVPYYVSSIDEFLFGLKHKPLDFAEQLNFVPANWDAIVTMFDSQHRAATHERLQLLGRERLKRTLPPWPTAILDFETFLNETGLTCQTKTAPDGALGDRCMQYKNNNVIVKITSNQGWRLAIADSASHSESFYHIVTIRKLLFPSAESKIKIPFPEWFPFAKSNWSAITEIFNLTNTEKTHEALQPLEAETQKRFQLQRDQQRALMDELDKRMKFIK